MTAAALVLDVCGIVFGLAPITYGSWLIYHPAGFIVAGVIVTVTCLLLARGNSPAPTSSPGA